MVRSRYNVVFTDTPKIEQQFTDHPKAFLNGESGYCSASAKYVAVHLTGGGGKVSINKLDNPGRIPKSSPYLSVHKGKVMDSQWSPFNSSMIATASDDCTVKLSIIPDEFTEHVTEAVQTMTGHGKKVTLLDWNKSATNILASVSLDRTCKVWDVSSGAEVSSMQIENQNYNSVVWSYDSSRLATTSKDGKIRIWDPRTDSSTAVVVDAFPAKKVNKVFWCGNTNYIGTVGAKEGNVREIKIWDVTNLEAPVATELSEGHNSTSTVAIPHYDAANNILYYFAKGASQVWFGEILGSGKIVTAGRQNLVQPAKGGCWVPSQGLDVMKCEVQRFMKLEANKIVPQSFTFPKKNMDVFHDDLFPDCFMGQQAMTGDEWLAGENKEPVLGSMDPSNRSQGDSSGGVQFVKKATYAELEAENQALKERVAELEAQLAQQ